MTTTMPTVRFAWNGRGNGLNRCAAGAAVSATTLVGFGPGPNTCSFAVGDDLLGRFGKIILPDVDSIETTEPDWELVAGGGVKAPIEVTTNLADALDAGLNQVWFYRLKVTGGEISTHATEVSGQILGNYEHPTTPEASQGNFRVRWKIAADPRCLQTNIQYWTGSAFGQSIIVHDSLTPAVVIPPGNGWIEFMVEFTGNDPARAAQAGYHHNLRLTVRSWNADGSVHLPITQVVHFPPGSDAYTDALYPRVTRAQLTSNAEFCIGRSYKTTNTAGALKGEIPIIIAAVRDGSASMITILSDAAEVMDYLRDRAPFGKDQCAVTALHAWTGEPRHELEDVARGGSYDLTEIGSGASVVANSAPIAGLPDRFRGYEITAKGLTASVDFTTEVCAALAAGKTIVFLSALNCNFSATDGIAHVFIEIGSNNTSLLRDRKASDNTLDVIIREGSTGITLDGGAVADLGLVPDATVIRLIQITPNAPWHQDVNPTVRHATVLDTLSLLGTTRAILYPDGSPANQAMLITNTNPMTIGVSATATLPLNGSIVLAYFTIDGGDLLDQAEAQDVMEGWWDASTSGLERWNGGGAARNRSRSRARAGAF